jgi:hypothetical protein
MNSGQDVSEYLDTLGLVKSYFSSFFGPCKEFYLKTCLFQPIGVVKKYDFVLEEEEDSWPQTPGEPKYIKIHSCKKQTAVSVGKKPL